MVAGKVMAADVVKLTAAETLDGQTVAINAEHGVMINDATVIKTDIEASNGVVHVIDTVLIPQNSKGQERRGPPGRAGSAELRIKGREP